MTNKKDYKFEKSLEQEYGEGGQYYWPFTGQDWVDSFRLVWFGYIYQSFKSFLRTNNIFIDREWNSSDDSDDEYYGNYQNKEEERQVRKEKEKFLTAKVETWPYHKIICSCIFYTLSQELEKNGCISSFIWINVIPNLPSSTIGSELLGVLKRNNFFKLDPTKVIEAASHFFRNNSQIRCALEDYPTPEIESGVLRVLDLLEVDKKVAKKLVTQAIKKQDINLIVSFLDTYVFP